MSEIGPSGGHHRKYNPAYARQLREGGKKAKKIEKESQAEHQAMEVPKAEEDLIKDLKNI